MKYKVGDKVVVRKDLDLNKRYAMADETSSNDITESMMEFIGKTVTISSDDYYDNYQYSIIEDSGDWYWTDDMFESEDKQL